VQPGKEFSYVVQHASPVTSSQSSRDAAGLLVLGLWARGSSRQARMVRWGT
jgi:hypothetical protein